MSDDEAAEAVLELLRRIEQRLDEGRRAPADDSVIAYRCPELDYLPKEKP